MTKEEARKLLVDFVVNNLGNEEFVANVVVNEYLERSTNIRFADLGDYQRGIEDGKIIAEHGTVNWIE